MRLRFALVSVAWLVVTFVAPPEWRVLLLAATGVVGAIVVSEGWRADVGSLGNSRAWLLGAVSAVVAAVVTHVAYAGAVRLVPALGPEVARLYTALGLAGHPWNVAAMFVVVVVEELLWRGAALRLGVAGPLRAALVASVLYAVTQAGVGSPVVVLVAFSCGVVWTALRSWTNGLAAPIACHAVWNACLFLWFPLAGPVAQ